MWIRSYSEIFKDTQPEKIWEIWKDVNRWHTWDTDIEFCKLTNPFAVGSVFTLKPKGAPVVKIQLVEVEEGRK